MLIPKMVFLAFPTLLALKSFNRSLKSEFTNIDTYHAPGVDDHFPGGIHPRLGLLRLPVLDVKRSVHLAESSVALRDRLLRH